MKRWAFGTSPAPYGLGLTSDQFWELSHREVKWLRRLYVQHQQFQITMLAHLRADIHNGWMPRKNEVPWQASDFGAEKVAAKERHPRSTMTIDQARSYFSKRIDKSKHKRIKPGEEGPAVASLVGQPLPQRA